MNKIEFKAETHPTCVFRDEEAHFICFMGWAEGESASVEILRFESDRVFWRGHEIIHDEDLVSGLRDVVMNRQIAELGRAQMLVENMGALTKRVRELQDALAEVQDMLRRKMPVSTIYEFIGRELRSQVCDKE